MNRTPRATETTCRARTKRNLVKSEANSASAPATGRKRPAPTFLLAQYRQAQRLTPRCTIFDSFRELLTCKASDGTQCRPTLYVTLPAPAAQRDWTHEDSVYHAERIAENIVLADLYDAAQAARGDGRRAVRY